jgi:hypothetical protein
MHKRTRLHFLSSCFLLGSSLWASDYTFLNPDLFVLEKNVFHLETDFGQVGSAKVTSGKAFGSKTNYGEGNASLYFSHFLNTENSLTWQVGANYLNLGWKDNPAFHKNQYTYGIGSLTWISHSIEKWRWVLNGGVAVDATTFSFGNSAVYYTMLWGRYAQLENLGVHLGLFAYYGAKDGYVLPILGIDWKMSSHWELQAVFPIDISLSYFFNPHLVTSLIATSLGGPYRFPRKIHEGIGPYDNGTFKVYSTVLEWDLSFILKNRLEVGAGGGWNFGGWIQVSDNHHGHKKYYNFNGAPYGRVFLTITL